MFRGRCLQKFLKIFKNSRGATAVEYGLVVALICIAALIGIGRLGSNVKNMYAHIQNEYIKAAG